MPYNFPPLLDCKSVFISFPNIKFPFQFQFPNDELLSAEGVGEAAPVFFFSHSPLLNTSVGLKN